MSANDFCYSYFSQLQYCNINKDIKVCFSHESYNEEQGIENNKKEINKKRNKYFITSNIEGNIAYYYTLYTFECLIDEIRIFYLIATFHFLIFTSIIYV